MSIRENLKHKHYQAVSGVYADKPAERTTWRRGPCATKVVTKGPMISRGDQGYVLNNAYYDWRAIVRNA
jgi:hypothetical protein